LLFKGKKNQDITITITLLDDQYPFLIPSRSLLLRKKNFRYLYREIQNTYIIFSNYFSEVFPVYYVIFNSNNNIYPDMPPMTVWRMCFSYWSKNGYRCTQNI
jgi:hypothetical protein